MEIRRPRAVHRHLVDQRVAVRCFGGPQVARVAGRFSGTVEGLFQTRPLSLAPQPRRTKQDLKDRPNSAAPPRHIRVASKRELKDRIMAAMDYFNHDPVVHTWTYKLEKAA
jgi:hypothetical protein